MKQDVYPSSFTSKSVPPVQARSDDVLGSCRNSSLFVQRQRSVGKTDEISSFHGKTTSVILITSRQPTGIIIAGLDVDIARVHAQIAVLRDPPRNC